MAAFLLSASLFAAPDENQKLLKEAVNLYNNGMYERAASLLDRLKGDATAEGYSLLCAVKMKAENLDSRVEDYENQWHETPVSGQIDWEYARLLFDQSRYRDAAARLARVDNKMLDETDFPELAFKQGYCDFVNGNFAGARSHFLDLEDLPMSDFKAPGRYAMASMSYGRKDFKDARKWFEMSASDPRFEELSKFYLVDCHFNLKDYDYVLSEGVAEYGRQPAQRQTRLARMISERSQPMRSMISSSTSSGMALGMSILLMTGIISRLLSMAI